ncbi:hypothetical protein BGZ76_006901 [Entomortierella beljakovae]|nr:hypothetical protein BGZ76_006901 [Entomortierella beljakovae]
MATATPSKRIPQQQYDLAGSSHLKYGPNTFPSSSSTSTNTFRSTSTRPRRYVGHYDIADRTFQFLSSFASPFATGVAFGLMVSLIHGLNHKGVLLVMTMYILKPYIERQSFVTSLNPPTVPPMVFLAPLASFCSAFGVLWLLYDLFGYLHASTDDLRDFFGITLPAPSIVTLKDVKDRSITLNWQCSSQATISKHMIEIDGVVIGESGKQETSVVIQGLYPDNTYRIRLWAITTRNWKTPSDYIVVRTLASIPVELLELSSAENSHRESELIKKLIRESEELHQLNKDHIPESSSIIKSQGIKPENLDSTAQPDTTNEDSKATPPTNTIASSNASVDGRISNTGTNITEEQISVLRVELEGKEVAHSQLTQQLADLEKQYKQQEDQLKSEIATLREQQRLEDEPRQQAKAKLKELQETLRESEAHKSKVEKEHRVEVEKRERMMTQLADKQRTLETLQQTLQKCEEKLKTEKASHKQRLKELQATLSQRSEEVKVAESSLKTLQDSQKTLCSTIEVKEVELQKLQEAINSPKGHLAWEQKSKDLDIQCTNLSQQLAQYKAENLQLLERLSEATKNVNSVRAAREARKAQEEARKARISTSEAAISQTFMDNQSEGDHMSSNWISSGWSNNPGTKILGGLFQDEINESDKPVPVRKTTYPPPGFSPIVNSPEIGKVMEPNAPGYGRDRKNSGSQNMSTSSRSPSRPNSQVIGLPKIQRFNSGLNPRSPSTNASMGTLMDTSTGIDTAKSQGMAESSIGVPSSGVDFSQGPRSRTSSISSLPGFQSPLFESPFVFSTHTQNQYDPSMTGQPFQSTAQSRQSNHARSQQSQGHVPSPHSRFQAIGQPYTSPSLQSQHQWTNPNTSRGKSGPVSTNLTSSSPLLEHDTKSSPNLSSAQSLNYHRYFGQPPSVDMSGILPETSTVNGSVNGSVNGHQMDEQNVIKSMFESPDTLDFRHHLRTVGSHSSLSSQSRIIPSHLRSTSTPGTSSPLSSPVTATLPPFQASPASPAWDFKPISRPSPIGRMNSQSEGSNSSFNTSNPSSPTSPQAMPFSQNGSGYNRKTLLKGTSERNLWGPYPENSYSPMNTEFNPGMTLDSSRAGSRWDSHSYDSVVPLDSDPWGQGDNRFKSNSRLPNVMPVNDSTSGNVNMEGMLPSPSGSSVSSLDTGTPLSVDALVFADHYFSSRSHRGFDTPSTLVPSVFPSLSSTRQSSGDQYSNHTSKIAPGRGNEISVPTSSSMSNNQTDIFGYGLQLNPFEWTMPSEARDGSETQRRV